MKSHCSESSFKEKTMKAIVNVTGKDAMGIIHKVSGVCAENGANIIDISQSVLKEYFEMTMLLDIDRMTVPFHLFVDKMSELGQANGLEIHTMHEDIFAAMHKI